MLANRLIILMAYGIVLTSLVTGTFHLFGDDRGIFVQQILVSFVASVIIIRLVLLLGSERTVRVSDFLFLVAFLCLLLLSGIIGLVRGFPITRVVVDVSAFAIPILVYLSLRHFRFNPARFRSMSLKFAKLFVIIFGCWAAFLYFLFYSSGFQFNISFGVPILVLVALILLQNGNTNYFILSLGLIMLSGKRSVVLFAVLAIGSLIVYRLRSKKIKMSSIRLVVTLLSIATLGVIGLQLTNRSIMEINPTLQKFLYLNPFSDASDQYRMTTGRLEEVDMALDQAAVLKGFPLIGAGAGFSYRYELAQFNFVEVRNNLHISPLNVLVKFGPLTLLLFYGYIISDCVRMLRRFEKADPFYFSVSLYLLLFIVFYASTAYAFAIDYSFWIIFGITSSVASRGLTSTPHASPVRP